MSKEIEKMTAIYEKHKNTMYAVALKILKNPQDAEDAVHNTIPPIMRNLDAIKDVDSKDCIYYVTMAVKHILMKDTYDYRVLDDILAPKEVRQNACLEALKARIKEVSK